MESTEKIRIPRSGHLKPLCEKQGMVVRPIQKTDNNIKQVFISGKLSFIGPKAIGFS
jgi:hypothetical protein